MKSIKDTIKEFFHKEILGTALCDKCNQDYEVYDFYIQGEKKGHVDYCEKCFRQEEEERLAREAVEERNQLRLRRFKQFSEIPFDLEEETFESYVPKNATQHSAKEISVSFANGKYDKTTLFFQGDTGLGKTHLSYCVYQSFVANKKGAIFTDLPSLLADIRNTFNNGNDYRATTQEDIMKAITDCELFVLDDIGAEYVKPDANGYESWAADILFQIANARQGKKNIYTTNFTAKHLTKKYGMMSKRILSRLMSNAKVIKVEGDDHRLKGLE